MLTHHYTAKEIRPTGWLRRQLEIQAEGLSGHLDKIWPDVRDSRWVGGDRDGWERVPYWLDGFIPLAYLLDDEDKKSRAKRYVDAILANQQEDGWLCPCTEEERGGYDLWALFLVGKVLTVYYDCTGDSRVPDALLSALRNLAGHLERYPLFSWGKSRWFECLIPIAFCYERTKEPWLLALARTLRAKGLDYEALYQDWPYREPGNQWLFESHVVNQAMALKAGALVSHLETGGEGDDGQAEAMLALLLRYHGMAIGHFTGDECLSGDSPTQGTELCGVVEAMYSYEVLYELTGKPIWADRLEKLAFNAFPAACDADMWTHQYDQMTNQIACVKLEPSIFRTNGPESGLFGLEPNYGCCTANFNQGWPKFALSTFYRRPDGIAAGAIAPAVLVTSLNGAEVTVACETDYPFGTTARYVVATTRPVSFVLTLRIPSFVRGAKVDGEEAQAGGTVTLSRTWEGKQVVTVAFDFPIRFEERPRGLFTLTRGPLVYTLDIGEAWTRWEYEKNGVPRKAPYCDYEIRPTTPWQFAFASLSPEEVTVEEGEISALPFSHKEPPVTLTVPVCPIDWGYRDGYEGKVARMTPRSAVPTGERERVRFKPYGCSNLHLTELPAAEGGKETGGGSIGCFEVSRPRPGRCPWTLQTFEKV